MNDETYITESLQALGIRFQLSGEGKNVSPGWIGLDCPFCGDLNKHLGCKLATLFCTCWRCKNGGHLFRLLQDHYDISWGEIRAAFGSRRERPKRGQSVSRRIEELLGGTRLITAKEKIERPPALRPVDNDKNYFAPVDDFLQRRGFSWTDAIRHEATFAKLGPMAMRMVMPIRRENKIIAYQGRALFDDMEPKYRAHGPINDCLYELDSCQPGRPLGIVEGIFDQWRMGDGFAASFGKSLSRLQIHAVVMRRPQLLYLIWDADAFWEIRAIRRELEAHGLNVIHIELPEGHDPDSFGREATMKLIEEKTI